VPPKNLDALPPASPDLPFGRRGLQIVDRIERIVDVEAARQSGLTAVDLSDDWAPIIVADDRLSIRLVPINEASGVFGFRAGK
jgi:hypothetical protein